MSPLETPLFSANFVPEQTESCFYRKTASNGTRIERDDKRDDKKREGTTFLLTHTKNTRQGSWVMNLCISQIAIATQDDYILKSTFENKANRPPCEVEKI